MKNFLYLTFFIAQIAIAAPAYQVVDLGEINAVPVAINKNGEVIAYEVSTDRLGKRVEQPLSWNGVAWRAISASKRENYHPQAMNNMGKVVGERYAESDGNRYAWTWDSTNGYREGDTRRRSSYVDINDSGDIAATAEDDKGVRNPYVISKGQTNKVLVKQTEGFMEGLASKMSNTGDVAGVLYEANRTSFYVATPDAGGYQVKKLPVVFGKDGFFTVGGINSNGIALLNENLCAEDNVCCDKGHGYRIWDSKTGKVLLSRFSKEHGNVGNATAINDQGTVVGIGFDSSGWIWAKAYGEVPVSLNSLVASGNWNILEPSSINSKGEILTTALRGEGYKKHIVILKPVN